MTSEHLVSPWSTIGTTTSAARRSSRIVSAPQVARLKANRREVNRLFEVEVAASLECLKGRRCGENTLGERRKGKGKWRETENVLKLDKIRSEGLEVWD